MVSKETDPSVLVNGHFDSPLGSPGAGDCGSCVASMLEIARLIVDSGWVPHRPVIFLFNGAEELFMLGSHGFMKTHKWRHTIGAFINVEASGTGGPDLVCQSGPSSWPSNVYAEAAIYPMANSAAEDVFPVIPGDTDYRIFSQDYGNIPGLDIIFLLGGYFYHTSSDTVERLMPGSIQARGENLFSIIKTFTNSSKLQNTYQTNYSEVTVSTFNDERAVFFDYFSWFMDQEAARSSREDCRISLGEGCQIKKGSRSDQEREDQRTENEHGRIEDEHRRIENEHDRIQKKYARNKRNAANGDGDMGVTTAGKVEKAADFTAADKVEKLWFLLLLKKFGDSVVGCGVNVKIVKTGIKRSGGRENASNWEQKREDATDNNGARKGEETPTFSWVKREELITYEGIDKQDQTTGAANAFKVQNTKGSTKAHPNRKENVVQGCKTWHQKFKHLSWKNLAPTLLKIVEGNRRSSLCENWASVTQRGSVEILYESLQVDGAAAKVLLVQGPMKTSQNWAKRIQEEWKSLEEDLPPPKPPDLNWRAASRGNRLMKRSHEIKPSISNLEDKALSDEASFWGGFGFYAILTMVFCDIFCVRIHASCVDIFLPVSQILWTKVTQFLIEKMGMMGSLPLPYGHYVPDIIVAAIIGIVTGWCTGPLMPICGHWLARSSILQFLLHLSVFGLALSSQFFPYTTSAPKRIVFQHTFHTAGSSQILESTYDFSVTDSNSLLFLFKHSPEVAKELNVTSEFSFESASFSKRNDWMAIFPVSFLFSNSLKFPAQKDDILKQYEYFPELSIQNPSLNSVKGPRRVHLELSLGYVDHCGNPDLVASKPFPCCSLQEVWVAVLNITGPLSSWSFADNLLPGTEIFGGGPQSYICRLSGPSDGNWTFWLEANSSEALRVDVAVLDQKLVDPMKRLKDLFPDWIVISVKTLKELIKKTEKIFLLDKVICAYCLIKICTTGVHHIDQDFYQSIEDCPVGITGRELVEVLDTLRIVQSGLKIAEEGISCCRSLCCCLYF
ncbi:hypothetical protein V8G54_000297 [Vigna mungo]|uniref:Peptidase M28 domain-containing protein n=1 Tax=Vigna mungo TaxID=3915 RepID=A0AAQ3S9S9_VIGMU